jgi:outer membrane autotransporter protein
LAHPCIQLNTYPQAEAGADPVPLYRLEILGYSLVMPAGWARMCGGEMKKSWSGTVSPLLDASNQGYQIGHDLYSATTESGQTQRIGLFVGQSRLRGDVDGFAEGFQHRKAGHLKLNGDHYGAYWTLVDPQGWYLDAVAMGTRLDGTNLSDRGVKLDTEGHAVTLSLEGGYPIPVSEHWVVEPQAQLIHQRIDLDKQNDGFSDVSFDSQPYWTGRLGARLKGRYLIDNLPIVPYLRTNLLHSFGGKDTTTYNGLDRIKTEHKASSMDVGIGMVAEVPEGVSGVGGG